MALPYNIVLLTQTNGALFGEPLAFALDSNMGYLYSLITGGITVNTVRNGNGAPSSGLGNDGDFYINDLIPSIYGPKTAGAWGGATSMVGVPGTNGTNGLTTLSGSGAPSSGLGTNGDFYIDTSVHAIYGPKSAGAWGSPTSLIGPSGPGGGNVIGPGSNTVGRVPQWSGTLVLADGLDVGVGTSSSLLNRSGGDGRYDALGASAAVTPTTLGLVIGTNTQAYSALLAAVAGLTSAADKVPYFTGSNAAAVADFTSQARTFCAAVDAAAQRTVLGLGSAATLNTGVSAGNIVVLNGSAQLPAVDGSLLTNLPAGTITSGQITTALGYVPTSVTGLIGAQTVGGFKAGLTLVKSDVGLGNVDNTSDANKPVSTAQSTAIALKLTASLNLSDIASASTARTNLGLGSAATLTAGTSANNAVQLDGSAKLPAVDGSQLTNLPGAGGSPPVLLATLTASTSASLSDTTHLTSTYSHYQLVFTNIVPTVNGIQPIITFSTNAGGSWLSASYGGVGAGNYVGVLDVLGSFAAVAATEAVVSTTGGGITGTLDFINPNQASAWGAHLSGVLAFNDGSVFTSGLVAGANSTASAINGIKFAFASGNIASGTIKIYGVP